MPAHFGQCFDRAGFTILQFPREAVLCHGIGVANVKGQEGWEIAHAWVELNGRAYDPIWTVHLDAEQYRAQLKISYIREYGSREAIALWVATDRPGPWDAKILAVIEGNRQRAQEWKRTHEPSL